MESNPASIDIVLVNYESTDYLLDCIGSIYDALGGRPARIHVEDNGSTDGVHRITQRYPAVHLMRNRQNLGFSVAVNRAMKRGDSDFIVLLNPDSQVNRALFDKALEYMRQSPNIGILGPRILDEDGGIQGSARSFPTPLTALFGRQSIISRMFPNNRITQANLLSHQSDGRTPMKVDWVSGACMIIRRKTIEDVGYLDERFFMYWEDADWCRRMHEKGWDVVYHPSAAVTHLVGKSSSKLVFRSTYEFHKSVYKLFQKYHQHTSWILYPIIFIGLLIRFGFVATSRVICERFSGQRLKFDTATKPFTQPRQRPIKVMRFIARLNIGGPAIHVHLLLKGLNKRIFESVLVAGKISPQEGDMGYLFHPEDPAPILIPELQREIRIRNDFQAFLKILQIIQREEPDIIHTHTAKAGFTARVAVMIHKLIHHRRVRVVHTFHGHVFEGYFNRFTSYLFVMIERVIGSLTDVIIAVSHSQKKELVEKFKIAPARKMRTVELGFDLAPFLSTSTLKGQFRSLLGVDADTLLIGIVGRLVPIKNHRMFLDAARLFYQAHPGMKVKFVVVGDGELRNDLEAYAEELRISEHVIFSGWIRNVAMVYADLDILALTSKNEGTPVSIIEAMAAGVPVIATHAGGVRDLLGRAVEKMDGCRCVICERGILCNKRDVGSVATGFEYLIRPDAATQGTIQGCIDLARNFVVEHYGQERLISDIEALYLELVYGPAGHALRSDRCRLAE